MRINSERIYSRNSYVILMRDIYSDADCRENVRVRTISSENGIATIHISYYNMDCELIEFDIRVRTH